MQHGSSARHITKLMRNVEWSTGPFWNRPRTDRSYVVSVSTAIVLFSSQFPVVCVCCADSTLRAVRFLCNCKCVFPRRRQRHRSRCRQNLAAAKSRHSLQLEDSTHFHDACSAVTVRYTNGQRQVTTVHWLRQILTDVQVEPRAAVFSLHSNDEGIGNVLQITT